MRERLSNLTRDTTPGLDATNRCPVCQARFRGSRVCSRCGADLEPLMLLAVKAWQLRQAARQSLDAGDFNQALGLASLAQELHRTQRGESLRLISAWLNAESAAAISPAPIAPKAGKPRQKTFWIILSATFAALSLLYLKRRSQ